MTGIRTPGPRPQRPPRGPPPTRVRRGTGTHQGKTSPPTPPPLADVSGDEPRPGRPCHPPLRRQRHQPPAASWLDRHRPPRRHQSDEGGTAASLRQRRHGPGDRPVDHHKGTRAAGDDLHAVTGRSRSPRPPPPPSTPGSRHRLPRRHRSRPRPAGVRPGPARRGAGADRLPLAAAPGGRTVAFLPGRPDCAGSPTSLTASRSTSGRTSPNSRWPRSSAAFWPRRRRRPPRRHRAGQSLTARGLSPSTPWTNVDEGGGFGSGTMTSPRRSPARRSARRASHASPVH